MKKLIKEDIQKRVLKGGEYLSLDLFEWDEEKRIFKSKERGLVFSFSDLNNINFDTGSNCTFKTGYNCTFDTGPNCIFDTGSNCTFKTGHNCTFDTSYSCTFDISSDCNFKKGSGRVIVRRDAFEIIQPFKNQKIQLCPYSIKGYLFEKNNKFYYSEDKENEYIIVDNILSKVISRKGNVLKVINYKEDKESYIIKDGDLYSHGETIKAAKLVDKIEKAI